MTQRSPIGLLAFLLALCALGQLTGCGATHTQSTGRPAGSPPATSQYPIAAIAQGLLGAPYRYGGSTPRGFDCSGLVQYAYRRAGIPIPRSASDQHRKAIPVRFSEARPGDILFFRISRRAVSHVGIYLGSDRFVHAPSSGKRVTYATLDNPYWRERLVGAGRFF